MRTLFGWFIKITGFIPQILIFRTKVYYKDKKVQGRRIKGKAIIMSNHNSLADFVSLMFVFFTRTLRCLMAEVLYKKNALFSAFLTALGGIKVDRESNDFSFVEKSVKVLNKKGVIEIYPESRLPRKDEKKPLEFKPSVVYIALKSGAPIIPVYTDGNYFNSKRNLVMIGTPVYVEDMYDDQKSEKENIDFITKKLRESVIELGEELERRKKNKEK